MGVLRWEVRTSCTPDIALDVACQGQYEIRGVLRWEVRTSCMRHVALDEVCQGQHEIWRGS